VWFNKSTAGKPHAGVTSICGATGFWNKDLTADVLFIGDSDIDYWPETTTGFPGSFNVGYGG